jgi:RNA polymerase sigma-70 factor (ECF subfamily)
MALTDGMVIDRTAATDDALIVAARGGDTAAFGALVAPRLARSVRMAQAILASEADALDAVQETFLAAWVSLPDLRDPARFDAWLNQVLANRCRDALRRRRRVREITIEDTEIARPDPSGASLERAAILAAFDRLSVPDRQILVLHHLEELPVEAVADRLGIPAGTVKSRLYAARRALERALETQR